jgi:hypothetical protein
MKKILLIAAIAAIAYNNAEAQAKSAFDKNYRVCRINDKYRTCDENTELIVSNKVDKKTEQTVASLRRLDTYVHMGFRPSATLSSRRNPRIHVAYDDPNGAYEGKETMINDGVKKNIHRNLNYITGTEVPPNDGGLSDR